MARDEIDPQFPFIQIHRSSGPKAAKLATRLGMTYLEVRGALAVFWETLADRRRVAKAIAAGKPFTLTDVEARRELQACFGRVVEPEAMEIVGFFEPFGEEWRVRGLSYLMEAEHLRLRKKRVSDLRPLWTGGGPGKLGGAPGFNPGSTGVLPGFNPAEVRGERREVKGDRTASTLKEEEGPSAPSEESPIETAFQEVPPERRDPNLRTFSDALCAEFSKNRAGYAYEWQRAKDTQALKRLVPHGLVEIIRRWRIGLQGDKYYRINTVAELAMRWNHFAEAQPAMRGGVPIPEQKPLPRYTDEELKNLYSEGGLAGGKKRA